MKYKPKVVKFEHTCKECLCTFKSADIKGTFCKECKKPKDCKCGCGKQVKTPGKYYASGCKTRGKTYVEIYKDKKPACGFKTGSENPMANPESKVKQSNSIKKSYTQKLRSQRREQKLKQIDEGLIYGKMRYVNYKEEKFRSILEYKFSEILSKNYISYEYEKAIFKLPDNTSRYRRKVVDFKVQNTLIEITGLAYTKWINEFIVKINLLKEVTDARIIILTYENKVNSIESLKDSRTFIFNFFDIEKDFTILNKHII